jgi:hypothetical protein
MSHDHRILGTHHDGLRGPPLLFVVPSGFVPLCRATTAEPVARVVFCFLTPAGAVERDLPDLPAAMNGVRDALRPTSRRC